MKKRSKYRPKGVRLDAMRYVLDGLRPVASHDAVVTLRLRNHGAMAALTKGEATRADLDILIGSLNMTEALYRMGVGREYFAVVRAGLEALRSVGGRGVGTGRFVLKSQEMVALNEAMELHDAQLDVITVKEMERALDMVAEEIRNKRATPIVEAGV